MKNTTYTTSKLVDNTLSSNAFFQVNKVMLKYLGSAEAAILLPEFIFSRNLFQAKGEDNHGWWFVTKEYLMEQTGFSEYVILKAEKLLESKGVLKTQLRGLPRKKYFFINDLKVNEILSGSITPETQDIQPKELSDVTLDTQVHNQNNSVCAPLKTQVTLPEELVGNNTVGNKKVIKKKIEKKNEINNIVLDSDLNPGYYAKPVPSKISNIIQVESEPIEPYSPELIQGLKDKGRSQESLIKLYPEYKNDIIDLYFIDFI
jgi:hypothetical protein